MRGQIVTPGAFYARAWVYLTTTLLYRGLFSLSMFGLLYTPGKLNASMLNDLAISRGEEEIEKSACRLTFMQTLPRRMLRFMQTKPGLFLTWFLPTGPQFQ